MSTTPNPTPFVSLPPSPQNAVDIFAGEWASQFPAGGPANTAGAMPLFEDPRILWADRTLREFDGSGLEGKSILELGPLEGGHTFMAARLGAAGIVAVEANVRAFLRCLVAKEILGIPRASFLLGDAISFLRANERVYDVCLAMGFLYHMRDPVEVIELLARSCRQVVLWTVVYSPRLLEKHPHLAPIYGAPFAAEWGGFSHTLYPCDYGESFDDRNFRGGVEPSSCWMTSDDILAAFAHFGFGNVRFELEDHFYGKALMLVAAK